ncbi:hypothetical protein EDD11_004568 [Mortierella claussenii]|nr:hypothetical protein EDD11_004568 [Mortierella claussenii]
MANQEVVSPNNTPWTGLQASRSHSHSSHTLPTSPGPSSSPQPHHSYSHPPPPPPHSSAYLPPHYYHHPPPPPSSHQQPYYPYHPYAAAPYPPPYASHTPPGHPGHPAYHHAPPHYPSSSYLQPPAAHDTVSSNGSAPSLPSVAPSAAFGQASEPSTVARSTVVETATAVISKTKSGKTESPSNGKTTSKTASASSSLSAPKTFRFEGSISSETYKTTKSFDLAGVNILNRKPLDTRTALDKLQRRRETHNRVERKRRDCINQLIDDLTRLLPPKHLEEVTSKCHRVNVLRGAVAHIKFLAETNATLNKSLATAEEQGFSMLIHNEVVTPTATATANSVDAEAGAQDDGMSMDVDAVDSIRQEGNERESEEDQLARAEKTSSRSSSLSVMSSASRYASPRMAPSEAMGHPPVIVTNAPSPSSENGAGHSKMTLVPPPISIFTAPTERQSIDYQSTELSHHRTSSVSDCDSPPSSFSASPMFPSPSYMVSTVPSSSAFPPSPVSPSPSARQNPFSQTEDSNKDKQQLSPFMQHHSASSSPSLPPISSLANMQLQSLARSSDSSPPNEIRQTDRSSAPSLRTAHDSAIPNGSHVGKYLTHRSGPTLPPLKIPGQQHLHPSQNDSGKASHRASQTLSLHQSSTSLGYPQRAGEEQLPVSPFMLPPMVSRSPSMGPLSSPSAGILPCPHWEDESSETHPPPPPPHPNHYILGSHSYPHGYPYPYPYHPSYGYPFHPHAPPSHVHHPYGPPPHQSAPSQPATARSLQPEPIFIQEEPWIVQRKRSTSNALSKGGAKQQQRKKSQGKLEEQEDQLAADDDGAPISPSSSSATSNTPYPMSPNLRKRSSRKGSYEDDEDHGAKSFSSSPKRVKQQELLNVDLDVVNAKDGARQRDSRVAVVVVETDSEMALVTVENDKRKPSPPLSTEEVPDREESNKADMSNTTRQIQPKADTHAAQVLTSLDQ